MTTPKQIYVIGLDDFNREQLNAVPGIDRFQILALLTNEEVKSYGHISAADMLSRAEQRLDQAQPKADALVTWWDFPATSLQAILCGRYGLPGPSLESTLKCEHKYWARREQDQVIPHAIPQYCAINPFDPPDYADVEVSAPFWLKPVKATDSMLGFRIDSQEDYDSALERTREKIGSLAKPFNEILGYAELPDAIQSIDGYHCLAEAIMSGSQHTVTGYVHHGKITIYGLVDSINYPGGSSFFRYEYPSRLDDSVAERMFDASRRVIDHIGLDDCAFNIEFFYDAEQDLAYVLEVNPRVSQSHSDVFHKVDGVSDEGIILQLGLGEDPEFPHREGDYRYAAMFYHRVFEDGFVRRAPGEDTLASLRQDYPEMLIHLEAEQGKHLSELPEQDSYSFVLAILFIGANTRDGLIEKYNDAVKRLDFEIDTTTAETG